MASAATPAPPPSGEKPAPVEAPLSDSASPVATPPPLAPVPAVCGAPALPASTRLRLEPFESGLPRAGQWRDGFDLADMNGDGKIDLLHGPQRKGAPLPAIFLGDGTGRFALWKTAHFPPDLPYDYGDVEAVDFNRDGSMDIVLASHLRGLTALLHERDGHYSPAANGLELRLPSGDADPPFASRAITITDWNDDALPDLLALNEGPVRMAPAPLADTLALYLNRNGLWQRVRGDGPYGLFGNAIAAGDVNGDGRRDAMIGSSVAGARSLLMLGDGRAWQPHTMTSLPEQASVTAVALHDLDADGRDEILDASIYPDQDGSCTAIDVVRYGNGEDLASRIFGESSSDRIVTVVVTDLDGDRGGDRGLDLLALRQSGAMLVFSGGTQGFAREADVPAPPAMGGCDAFHAETADLDHDGTQEVIVSFAGELTPGIERRCPGEGGFVAWRVSRGAATDAGE